MLRLLTVIVLSPAALALLVYAIGMTRQEKQLLTRMFLTPVMNRLWTR